MNTRTVACVAVLVLTYSCQSWADWKKVYRNKKALCGDQYLRETVSTEALTQRAMRIDGAVGSIIIRLDEDLVYLVFASEEEFVTLELPVDLRLILSKREHRNHLRIVESDEGFLKGPTATHQFTTPGGVEAQCFEIEGEVVDRGGLLSMDAAACFAEESLVPAEVKQTETTAAEVLNELLYLVSPTSATTVKAFREASEEQIIVTKSKTKLPGGGICLTSETLLLSIDEIPPLEGRFAPPEGFKQVEWKPRMMARLTALVDW